MPHIVHELYFQTFVATWAVILAMVGLVATYYGVVAFWKWLMRITPFAIKDWFKAASLPTLCFVWLWGLIYVLAISEPCDMPINMLLYVFGSTLFFGLLIVLTDKSI